MSVTFKVTMKLPRRPYVCNVGLPVAVVPSPKFHLRLYGAVPPEKVAVYVAGLPTHGLGELTLKSAVSASGRMTTIAEAVAELGGLEESVTVTVTV